MVDLKDRTLKYAIDVRKFVRSVEKDRLNQDDLNQLIRSSGSVGANFIEAIESLSKRDYLYRLRICLKECKESRYWLIVIQNTNQIANQDEINILIQESKELIMILSSIIIKHKS
jgi:four helix bundle protein